MQSIKLIFLAFLCAAVFINGRQAEAQTITAQNVSGSGALLANGEYRLWAAVGQPMIGVAQNSSHVNSAGFGYTFASRLMNAVEQTDGNSLPTEYRLEQNYPNPFNPTTTIGFALPQQSFVTLRLFDLLGREVATLVHKELPAGEHRVIFSAQDLPSGIYLDRMEAKSFVQQRKLAVMK